ncbi:MAG: response regulator [Novosphingobium sp.]|nr:response regulator [Novosphingobium sp.]
MTDKLLLLLAEDEPIIQLAAQDVLEHGGYAVVTASDGIEAMAVIDEPSRELAGLVTDIDLGDGANGWQLAHRAREVFPLIPVVYTSGGSVGDWQAHGVPKSMMLAKPYADAQLLTAISTLLNEAAVMNVLPHSREDDRTLDRD